MFIVSAKIPEREGINSPSSFKSQVLFIYLFNNLFKVDKFTIIQYTYIHKYSQTNSLIKVNYPILQKNLV